MVRKKRIVVIGGGTGTHTILRGLRNYVDQVELSAIVSMADSGGSTGLLRDEFGLLPIGDVRNALTALAAEGDEYDSLLRQLFMYRFDRGSGLSGHNFGNLFLTALTDILGSEEKAIAATAKILKISGQVIPVTTNDVQLVAHYDEISVVGEANIEKAENCTPHSRIRNLTLSPEASITKEASDALQKADLIVFGPGDLYTSILANCVVNGFSEALSDSQAKVVYVCNLMAKKGQTLGLDAEEHISEIKKYSKRTPDVVLLNSDPLPTELLLKYEEEGVPVRNNCVSNECYVQNLPLLAKQEVKLQSGDIVKRSLIRHDSELLAEAVFKLL